MKTQLSNSILTVSLMSLWCGACGTAEELSTPVALQAHAPMIAERNLHSSLSTGKPHCVATIAPAGENGTAPSAASPTEPKLAACFETIAEAVSFATEGRVQLPAGIRPEEITPDQLSTASAPYVIGIEYTNRDFGGFSLTLPSDVNCTTNYFYVNILDFWWNDAISSAKAFSGCNHSYHYEHPNFGGAMVDCGSECSYIGDAMNNRTSSIRWTQ